MANPRLGGVLGVTRARASTHARSHVVDDDGDRVDGPRDGTGDRGERDRKNERASRDLARRRPERERDATRGGARTRSGRARGGDRNDR